MAAGLLADHRRDDGSGWFTLADVASGMHDKLVRRHPHVFDPGYDRTPEVHELIAAWESDKRAEMGRGSIMDGIPTAMPALARALKVLRKAESIDPQPRSGQLAQDQPAHDQPAADPGTLGRALWALVESAHAAGLDPEDALRVETDRRIATLRDLERRSG